MRLGACPFQFGPPIRDPADFIGRQTILMELNESMLRSRSVSILAERRMGATSLLLQLMRPENTAKLPDVHIPIYIDCQRFLTRGSMGRVLQTILESVALEFRRRCPPKKRESLEFLETIGDLVTDDESWFITFDRALMRLATQGFRIHLLLDEFEQMFLNPNFDLDFLHYLRALTSAGDVSYVTVTRMSLVKLELEKGNDIGSPFSNVFSCMTLPPFKKTEATELICTYFAKTGLDPSLAEKLGSQLSLLYDTTGYHPFFLQMLCHHLYNKLDYPDWPLGKAWQEATLAFRRDAAEHFDYFWRVSSETERELLKKIANQQSLDIEDPLLKEQVHSLTRRYLAVTDQDSKNGYRLFSSAFRDWCLSQYAETYQFQEAVTRRDNQHKLRELIDQHFNEGELRSLCFDLHIDSDNLPGEAKSDKCRELIAYCERHGCTAELVEELERQRSNVSWDKAEI